MIKLKPKMLRGISFSIESNGREISVDSLFPRGFKTKLIERFLEEFSRQVGTDDPEKFVRALFYFVYGDNVPKHAREREPDIIEFLKWGVGNSAREAAEMGTATPETVPGQVNQVSKTFQAVDEVKKEPEPVKDEIKGTPKATKKRISFTDVLPYAYRGGDE